MELKKEIGSRLKIYRELLAKQQPGGKLSAESFAALIGTIKENVYSYERGVSIPLEILAKLYDAGCNLNWLLTGIGQPFFTPKQDDVGAPVVQSAVSAVTLNGVKAASDEHLNMNLEQEVVDLREKVETLEDIVKELVMASKSKFPRKVAATPPKADSDEPEFVE